MINLVFTGKPKAVQSFRFANRGKFTVKYQPKEVVDWKKGIVAQAREQLPHGHKPWGCPIQVKIDFVFAVPKSYKKMFHEEVKNGIVRYKTTKPDLTDNLPKGLIDALSGILWESDQLICKVESRKVYGSVSHTTLEVERMSQFAEDNPEPNSSKDNHPSLF